MPYLIGDFQIRGFIADIPYVDFSTVLEFVKKSQIFDSTLQQTEFILAIHLHTYPNHVFALWIAAGCNINSNK